MLPIVVILYFDWNMNWHSHNWSKCCLTPKFGQQSSSTQGVILNPNAAALKDHVCPSKHIVASDLRRFFFFWVPCRTPASCISYFYVINKRFETIPFGLLYASCTGCPIISTVSEEKKVWPPTGWLVKMNEVSIFTPDIVTIWLCKSSGVNLNI